MKLDETGITLSTPDELRQALIDNVTAKIPEFSSLPYELQQNLIDSSVEVLAYIEQTIGTLFNSFSTDYATNPMFDRLGRSFGITRKAAIYSSANVVFSGAAGIVIPEGVEVTDADGNIKVKTAEQAVIPTTGSVTIFCESEDYSDAIPANTLTKCDSLVNVTVTQPTAGTGGLDAETITQFRSRVWDTIKGVRQGSLYAFRSAVLAVPGVDSRLVNAFAVDYAEGSIGYRGITVIVGGGDDYEVAEAIMASFLETQKLHTENVQDGDVVTVDLDIYGNAFPVSFIRPAICKIIINVSILTDYNTDYTVLASTVKDAVTAFVNGLSVGAYLSKSELHDLYFDTIQAEGVPLSSIKIKSEDYKYNINQGAQAISFDNMDRWRRGIDSYYIVSTCNIEVTNEA